MAKFIILFALLSVCHAINKIQFKIGNKIIEVPLTPGGGAPKVFDDSSTPAPTATTPKNWFKVPVVSDIISDLLGNSQGPDTPTSTTKGPDVTTPSIPKGLDSLTSSTTECPDVSSTTIAPDNATVSTTKGPETLTSSTTANPDVLTSSTPKGLDSSTSSTPKGPNAAESSITKGFPNFTTPGFPTPGNQSTTTIPSFDNLSPFLSKLIPTPGSNPFSTPTPNVTSSTETPTTSSGIPAPGFPFPDLLGGTSPSVPGSTTPSPFDTLASSTPGFPVPTNLSSTPNPLSDLPSGTPAIPTDDSKKPGFPSLPDKSGPGFPSGGSPFSIPSIGDLPHDSQPADSDILGDAANQLADGLSLWGRK